MFFPLLWFCETTLCLRGKTPEEDEEKDKGAAQTRRNRETGLPRRRNRHAYSEIGELVCVCVSDFVLLHAEIG
jgi:hypothetical protein